MMGLTGTRPVTKIAGREAAAGLSAVPFPVAIFLIAVALPFSFPAGPLVMTGVRFLMILIFLPALVRLLSGKSGPLNWTDALFGLHVLWITIAMVVNNPNRVVPHVGSTGLEFLGGYLLGRCYIQNRAQMIGTIRFLALVICATLPFAFFELLTGTPLLRDLLDRIPGIGVAAPTFDEKRLGLDRVQMAYATPIHYGVFAILVVALYFVGLAGTVASWKRWVVSGLACFAVFSSLSSGALLPMVLQIFLIIWNAVLGRVNRRWLLLSGLLVLAYVAIDLASNRTPLRVFMSYATFSAHTAYWRFEVNTHGMENVWANPLFGLGLRDWTRPDWMHSGSVDNFWLLMAMRYGIPGFLLVATGWVVALWRIARRDFSADVRLGALRLGWVLTFVAMSVSLFTVHIWVEVYALCFFLFGAGMWLLTAEPENTAPTREAFGRDLHWNGGQQPKPDRHAVPHPKRGGAGARYSRFAPRGREVGPNR